MNRQIVQKSASPKASTRESRPEVVVLRRSGQYTIIDPPVPGLDDFFYTCDNHLIEIPGQEKRIVTGRGPLIWKTTRLEKPVLQTFAGLEPLLHEHLKTKGYKVRLKGTRPRILPEPETKRVAAIGPADVTMLDFVRHHDRGLIRLDGQGGQDAALAVAQIALAWPRRTIVVVATRPAEARRVARRLKKSGIKVGLSTARDGGPQARRVVVATPSRLRTGPIAIEKRQIYIALDPTELFNGGDTYCAGMDGIRCLWRGRVFGLLDRDATLAPRLRDLMTALFGHEQVRFRPSSGTPVEIRVVFSKICGGDRVPHHRDDSIVKQNGIYRHELRNRRICHLARALVGGNSAELRKYPEVAPHFKKRCVRRVGVLVDNVEHGLALAQRLGWPLVAAEDTVEDGLSAEHCALLKRGRESSADSRESVVLTTRGLERAGRFKVLVRADGGMGGFALPPALLLSSKDAKKVRYIVDFRDEQHPVLRRWSRQRRTAYVAEGFKVIGEPEISPLDRFLACRPEVEV